MKRNVYHILLLLATILLLGSCSSSRRAAVSHKGESVIEHERFVSHLPKNRKKIIEEAETWLGTPYKYAAAEKGVGTDCSGLVMRVFLTAIDCSIPRNSARQAEYCRRVKQSEIMAGDLVFFATGSDPARVSHVGIIVDTDRFIHASSSKGVVISKLSNPWYAKRLLMFGRIPALDETTAAR